MGIFKKKFELVTDPSDTMSREELKQRLIEMAEGYLEAATIRNEYDSVRVDPSK